jgi:hypothetical protein
MDSHGKQDFSWEVVEASLREDGVPIFAELTNGARGLVPQLGAGMIVNLDAGAGTIATRLSGSGTHVDCVEAHDFDRARLNNRFRDVRNVSVHSDMRGAPARYDAAIWAIPLWLSGPRKVELQLLRRVLKSAGRLAVIMWDYPRR